MAGYAAIGWVRGEPDDVAGGLDYDAVEASVAGKVAALNAIPRPSRTVIRSVCRSVFAELDGNPKWDAKGDVWIAWTLAGWDIYGLRQDAIGYILEAMTDA